MFSKSKLGLVALAMLSVTDQALGRIRWMERDNRPVHLNPRRFGQENPPVIQKLSAACPGQVCGVLAGEAVTPLLAAQPECSQQDHADKIIDAAQQFDEATKANMIALAIEYRQAEKNTPPDFSTNPPTARNSVFCQKAPKNPELNGLVQAQDPANDPNIFFDPALGASVTKGSQPNTEPFGGAAAGGNANAGGNADANNADTSADTGVNNGSAGEAAGNDGAATGTAAGTGCQATITVTVSGAVASATPTDAPPDPATGGNTGAGAGAGSNIGDFGSCSVPQIEFGAGFDGRKETSFQPADKQSYNHGSAQNINIISEARCFSVIRWSFTHDYIQFICDTLVNSCGADQTAQDTCAQAEQATAQQDKNSGAAADTFNSFFGITTNFAATQIIDNQGNVVGGGAANDGAANGGADTGNAGNANTGNANTGNANTGNANTGNADTGNNGSTDNGNANTGNAGNAGAGNAGGAADFGSCTTPEIDFAQGFDNRKETSFQPADLNSYNHGSAQGIAIITRFICDTLTNKCNANQAAKDLCQQASAAADAAPPKTGAQADAFNAVFGIQTNLNSVQPIDDQGRPVN
ncbi:hypothetical protein WG66_016971 [Moniliophthora roreri]|uniref:Uncharacterized protein n=1 Tax=Moniliophthora roreri TaxID=221103 RepID=A0A0W0EXX8_MONRR|nr:hypothetical protein WG66_016971 [Moniliophthora roreri]